jgi:ATP-binding cassette subfamily B (MDR/TAP) protein 1
MEEIREWRQNKTTIIITHDLSRILDDEYVYVLGHVSVVQEGYRKDLVGEKYGAFTSFLPVHNLGHIWAEQRKYIEGSLPISPTSSLDDTDKERKKNALWPTHIFPSEFLQTLQLAKLRLALLNFLSPRCLSVLFFQNTPRSNILAENEITGIQSLENAKLAKVSRSPLSSVSTAVTEPGSSPIQI